MEAMTPKFTVLQIINDARFRKRADALRVALGEGEYTLEEAQAKLKEFMERTGG